MILHSKICRMGGGGIHSRNPQAKTSCDGGGGGGGGFITRPTTKEKMYLADQVIHVYSDGKVNISKDRNGDHGPADINMAVEKFSKILANMKLKDTDLSMFKEGLSELLQEAITNILKGKHYERTIRAKSTGHGSKSNWSP